MSAIRIIVNGQARSMPPSSTVADLVAELGLGGRPLAIEVNGELVTVADASGVGLSHGDRVDLAWFVGGG